MLKTDTAIYTAYEDHRAFDPAESERNLMREILKTAMDDINRRGEARRDARLFFTSNDELYLFSFISICRHLNLCPQTIRDLVGVSPMPSLAERMAA